MSVGVYLKDLTQQNLEVITNLLTIKPTLSFYDMKRKKYWKKDDDDIEIVKSPVKFYKIENDAIFIPYFFYEQIFKVKSNINKKHFNCYPATNFTFTKELFEAQKNTCNELHTQLFNFGVANLNVYTGGGKTVMCAWASSMLKYKTLILITNTILAEQWEKTYKKFTNAKVYLVNDIGNPPEDTEVIVCMYSRIHYMNKNVFNTIGTLILDEAHTFCSESRVASLLITQPLYIIAATATLEREADGMHVMIETMCGKSKIIKKSTKPFNVIMYNTGYSEPVPKNRFGDPDWTTHVNNLCNDGERNKLILEMITNNLNYKILVLTGRSNHVKYLHSELLNKGIKVDYMTGNKKKYTDSNVLIGTVKKIGTGFDEASFAEDYNGFPINLLIIAISIKNTALLQQSLGRSFRSEAPTVFVMYDENSISEKHMSKNRKIFEEMNGIVYYVESPKCKVGNRINNVEKHESIAEKHIAKYINQ